MPVYIRPELRSVRFFTVWASESKVPKSILRCIYHGDVEKY